MRFPPNGCRASGSPDTARAELINPLICSVVWARFLRLYPYKQSKRGFITIFLREGVQDWLEPFGGKD